ncbi:unnamed protein product [Peniophora sp. CBMAI 1063]|nr:unnamed protein product [Peniophora sp. CBMAI 1063]
MYSQLLKGTRKYTRNARGVRTNGATTHLGSAVQRLTRQQPSSSGVVNLITSTSVSLSIQSTLSNTLGFELRGQICKIEVETSTDVDAAAPRARLADLLSTTITTPRPHPPQFLPSPLFASSVGISQHCPQVGGRSALSTRLRVSRASREKLAANLVQQGCSDPI